MEFALLEEEKRNISSMINKENLFKINYILDDLETNLQYLNKNAELSNIYREISKLTKIYFGGIKGIYKNYVSNQIEKLETIAGYNDKIDMSDIYKETMFFLPLSFSDAKYIYRSLEGNKIRKDIILVGSTNLESLKYKLEKTNESYIIFKLQKDPNVISFKGEEFLSDVHTEIIVAPYEIEIDVEKLGMELSKYRELQKENLTKLREGETITKTYIKEINGKITSKMNYDILKKEMEKITEENTYIYEDKQKSEEFLISAVDIGSYLRKLFKNSEELKTVLKDKKITDLMESRMMNSEGNEENIAEVRLRKSELEVKKEILEKNILEIENIIKAFKDTYKYTFANISRYIKYLKLEEKRYEEAGINEAEKIKLTDLERVLRTNKNKTDEILKRTISLIKKQQKYAKIGAETNSKYTSIIDGFAIKNEAERLKAILDEMYNTYKEYVFNKLRKKTIDKSYELKLGKILEVSNKVEVFLNYIFNPKNAKKKTDLNRFDELILIEENEIKRKITQKVDKLIGDANLLIIDDEIDEIEAKKVVEKLIDLLTGKRKKEKYRAMRLEELAEDVDAKINQTYTINRNYKIHDVIAKIMIFKAENIEEDIIEKEYLEITDIEKAIAQNFIISENKVLEKIDELKMTNLPSDPDAKTDQEALIDMEIAMLKHKYEYDNIYNDEEIKYVDTTANEIKQVSEYIKTSL